MSKQIDIRAFDKLRWLDPELLHEHVSFLNAYRKRFIVFEHDLKLHELTKTMDFV